MYPPLPEPFRSALARNAASEVGDAPAGTPLERFARGMARVQAGRYEEARSDLEASLDHFGPAARAELDRLGALTGRDAGEIAAEKRRRISGRYRRVSEPFSSALDACRPAEVADREALDAGSLLGRALARVQLGRFDEARADLEGCRSAIGPLSAVELAHIDVLTGHPEPARQMLEPLAAALDRNDPVRARALHVLGLACAKTGRGRESADWLLGAAMIYSELGEEYLGDWSQVQDSLGLLFAAEGRPDFACVHYGLSLATKSLLGDRFGMAITLGSMGRLNLADGRHQEAFACFDMDHRIASEIGDVRGAAQSLADRGRALLSAGDREPAERDLRRALDEARRAGLWEVAFFSLKELAHAALAGGRPEEAFARLEEAERERGTRGGLYHQATLLLARGQIQLRTGDAAGAATALRDACRIYQRLGLPALEIPSIVEHARSLVAIDDRETAQAQLAYALRLSSCDGLARFQPSIREAIEELRVVLGADDEAYRLPVDGGEPVGPDGYLVLGKLGRGGFGETWKAYDPLRRRIVVVKRYHLHGVFAPSVRCSILTSARMEWEAASLVRHPGVARVLALGTDSAGETYVVQEFVEGPTLRDVVPKDVSMPQRLAVETARMIAEVLEAIHEEGVIHRDLKPANVVLRHGRVPVLVDFGIAFVEGVSPARSATVAGTPEYMAPEQRWGARFGPKVDVFALGVILHEMLTGLRPFRPQVSTSDPAAVMRDLDRQRFDAGTFRALRPDSHPKLATLLASMLHHRASQRPTAAQVAAACAETLTGLPADP